MFYTCYLGILLLFSSDYPDYYPVMQVFFGYLRQNKPLKSSGLFPLSVRFWLARANGEDRRLGKLRDCNEIVAV